MKENASAEENGGVTSEEDGLSRLLGTGLEIYHL